jgi:phage-related protein (TIGR01555 family)
MVKSVVRGIVIDKGLEEFERMTTSFTGLPELMDKANERLAAAADMPLMMLMGKSPGGLGSNGDGETRNFYDKVASKQQHILVPAIAKIVEVLSVKYKLEPGWHVEFPPLWQPSETETAQSRNVQAQTDQIYIANNVLTPEEVAQARYGGASYSFETPIDFAARASFESLGGNDPTNQIQKVGASVDVSIKQP